MSVRILLCGAGLLGLAQATTAPAAEWLGIWRKLGIGHSAGYHAYHDCPGPCAPVSWSDVSEEGGVWREVTPAGPAMPRGGATRSIVTPDTQRPRQLPVAVPRPTPVPAAPTEPPTARYW